MAIHDFSEACEDFADAPETPRQYNLGQLIGFRLLMLIGAAVCFFAVFVASLVAALTLPFHRRIATTYWGYARLSAACLTGCLAGIVSPRFGVTIICVWLLLCADQRKEGRFSALIRTQFQEAFYRF